MGFLTKQVFKNVFDLQSYMFCASGIRFFTVKGNSVRRIPARVPEQGRPGWGATICGIRAGIGSLRIHIGSVQYSVMNTSICIRVIA